MSFDEIFDLTAGVYFLFFMIYFESPTYILNNEDPQPVIRAIGVSHTACKKISFDKILDLTAGVYFNFCNIYFDTGVHSLSYDARQ